MKLLSFIVPCHNSEKKCRRLLDTLSMLNDGDVEILFIDDGSTDGTLNVLEDFKERRAKVDTRILTQENKGPGGARNTGLRAASGEYVWFVDSDDDVNPDAIDVLRKVSDKNFDFVDFEVRSETGNVRPLPVEEGEYTNGKTVRKILLEHMSILTNKCVRRTFLLENDLFYPEYCIYEDNPVTLLIPFFVKSFYKSRVCGYYQYRYEDSVSKAKIDARYFDRLWTMVWGLSRAYPRTENDYEKSIVFRRFTRIYLINTIGPFMTPLPSSSWLTAMSIMKGYRSVLKAYTTRCDPLGFWKFSLKYRILFRFLWVMSYLIKKNDRKFAALYKKAWPNVGPESLAEKFIYTG